MNTYEINPNHTIDRYFPTKTMKDMMKLELLVEASKLSLEELEKRIGTKTELQTGKIKA
jgi:hypothetical protein